MADTGSGDSPGDVGLPTKRFTGLTVKEIQVSLNKLLPNNDAFIKEHIIDCLCPSDEDYKRVQQLLEERMVQGLARETHVTADVKMYNTYVREVPNGTEKGKFLAVDFSGHNFRVLLEYLNGHETSSDSKRYHIPNRILSASGKELFDYIAQAVKNFLNSRNIPSNPGDPERLPLGLTFSFPCQQLALNRAVLTKWTKGFHCEGVVGEDVGSLLQEALDKRLAVEVEAIVNDTVGTLMTGCLQDPKCAVGLILAKGVNACYIESIENVETWDGENDEPKEVIINTEWHTFGRDGCLDFILSPYDRDVDENCIHKGDIIFENMSGGMYLGELVRLAMAKLRQHEVLFHDHWSDVAETRGTFFTKYLSEILDDDTIRFQQTRHVLDEMDMHNSSETECRVLHHLCQLVTIRAARLNAIGIACLLNRMKRPEVGIAVDGFLYRFHHRHRDLIEAFIPLYLKSEVKFWFVLARDGCGKGAALAAAVAARRPHSR